MGVALHALTHRSDNKLYHLQTAQSPLVRPYLHDDLNMDDYPLGTNAIVAVLSYTVCSLHNAHCMINVLILFFLPFLEIYFRLLSYTVYCIT